MVRYGHFDESMCKVGETFSFDGFLSISYADPTVPVQGTGVKHFAQKPDRWKIIVLAPKGTKGIRLNDQFNALTTEKEWLLRFEYFNRKHTLQTVYNFPLNIYFNVLYFFFKKCCEDIIFTPKNRGRFPQNHGE